MEESRKRKPGLELDFNKLLGDDSDPPSVVIVKTGHGKPSKRLEHVETVGGDDERSKLDDLSLKSDEQLNEYLERQRRNHNNPILCARLPDKGEKIKLSIKMAEDEFERRLQSRNRKEDNGYGKPTEARDSSIVGPSDFKQGAPNIEHPPQSSFASGFLKKLERVSCRPLNAFVKDLNTLHPCDSWKPQDNMQFVGTTNYTSCSSTRETPYKWPCNVSNDDDELIISNSHQVGKSPACCPCVHDSCGFSSTRDSKCKPIFAKPISTVVLLDEEESLKDTYLEAEKIDDCLKDSKIYYPSRDDPEALVLHYSSIECLEPEGFLSSTILNFYIRYLQLQKFPPDISRCDYHIFNTYFYSKLKEAVLSKRDKETLFAKLRRWWKGVNLFEKAYVLLPIHENLHWSLVIICIPDKEDGSGPVVLHLDSLGLHFSKSIFENVRSFLEEEWRYQNQGDAPSDLPIADKIWRNLPRRISEKKTTVPQQKNDYDCGVFVLFFMERFIEDAPKRMKRNGLEMLGRQWFKPERASGLRNKIRSLLIEQFKKARENGNELTDSDL